MNINSVITPRRAAIIWFLIAAIFSFSIQYGWSHKSEHSWTRLLNVGESSVFRPYIEKDIGPVDLSKDIGHDGQWTWIVARDPFLIEAQNKWPELLKLDDFSYRYRRILYPLMGGGAGSFSAQHTLLMLILINSIAFGVIAAVTAWLMQSCNCSVFMLLGVFVNFGLINSLITLTVDVSACAFFVLAVLFAYTRRLWMSCLFCALSALTKETYIIGVISCLVIYAQPLSWRDRICYMLLAVAPVLCWSLYLHCMILPASNTGGFSNFDLPFHGIVDGMRIWLVTPKQDQFFSVIVFISVLCAGLISFLKPRLALIFSPWLLLALFSSHLIWDLGNNSSRVFAPLWWMVFVSFALGKTKEKTFKQMQSS